MTTTRRLQQKGYPGYRPCTVHGDAAGRRSSTSLPAPGPRHVTRPRGSAAAGSNFPRTALRGAGGQGLVTHGPRQDACAPCSGTAGGRRSRAPEPLARQRQRLSAWLCLRLHGRGGVGPRANFKPENPHGWLACSSRVNRGRSPVLFC
jgi:hypothetical protein